MALGRFLALLRVRVLARGRRATAAAAARGQQARSCTDARVRAIRAQGEVATSAAEARARAAIAGFLRAQRQAGTAAAVAGDRLRQARACADARVRAIRAHGEVATSAAAACAEARARAAFGYLLRAQRQAAAAAHEIRHAGARSARAYFLRAQRQAAAASAGATSAGERAVTSLLYLAYGRTGPQTIREVLEILAAKAERLNNLLDMLIEILEVLEVVDPCLLPAIIATLASPFVALFRGVVSTAPESACPFLGIRVLELQEFPAKEGLIQVLNIFARCGCFVLMVAAALPVCLVLDISELCIGLVRTVMWRHEPRPRLESKEAVTAEECWRRCAGSEIRAMEDIAHMDDEASLKLCPTSQEE